MKVKYIGTLLLAVLTFFGCDDNTGTLGIDMLPGSDGISAHTTTFEVETKSVPAGAVYAKTSTGYVGKFTDPDPNGFGDYEASFLTQLNCTDNFTFPKLYQYDEKTKTGSGIMAGDSVVSTQLVIYYSNWFGDSLNACRMSVYEFNGDKELTKGDAYYTNINPENYYDKYSPKLLGRKAYSAYDTSVPDSVRNATDASGNKTFYPNITFPQSKEFGNRILELNRAFERKENDFFANAENFIKNVFKGVYIKTDYGDGTILYIDRVDLQMQFRFHYVNDTTGVKLKKKNSDEDSLYYSMNTVFASTKEVIQANQFQNSELLQKKIDEKGYTYIKSPAGIFTQATMPYDDIYKELSQDTLNAVKLTFTNYNQEDKYKFNMSAPNDVLLIRKQDLKTFFEENKVVDNVTSFTVTHNNVATNQYTFRNIARLVTTCINEKQAAKKKAKEEAGTAWDEAAWEEKWKSDEATKDWDKVLLIPVNVIYDNTSQNKNITGIQNDLQPGYAKLKGGPEGESLKLEVTYTRFNK